MLKGEINLPEKQTVTKKHYKGVHRLRDKGGNWVENGLSSPDCSDKSNPLGGYGSVPKTVG